MTNEMDGCWFNLPDGETAKELEVTIPVKGRVLIAASLAEEVDQFRDELNESMQKRGFQEHGRLAQMLRATIQGYENIASDALAGASSVRDDMLVMLRSVLFVLETVVGDHLNHSQKNERIRGCMSVLERHVQSLREERFDFREMAWRRDRDLFRWDERERRLRERIRDLQSQLKGDSDGVESGEPF